MTPRKPHKYDLVVQHIFDTAAQAVQLAIEKGQHPEDAACNGLSFIETWVKVWVDGEWD